MANWSSGQLTAAGRKLQLKVEAGLTKLELTRIKIGDGTETAEEADALTDLVQAKSVFGISSITLKDGMCVVSGIVLTSTVPTAYYAREWGLFATDPDEGEILYMVALDDNPDYIPPSSSALKVSVTYAMQIVASNAAEVHCILDPSGLVNVEMLQRSARTVMRSTAYDVGDLVYDIALPPSYLLYCEQSGETSAALVDFSSAVLGQCYIDGTVRWRIERLCTTTASEDIYDRLNRKIEDLTKMCQVLMRMTGAGDVLNTTVSTLQPTDRSVWIQTEGEPTCRTNPAVRILAEDGTALIDVVARIVSEDGRTIKVASEWATLADSPDVKAGSTYRLITSDGAVIFNGAAQVVTAAGKVIPIGTTGSSSTLPPTESTETFSDADINSIFS